MLRKIIIYLNVFLLFSTACKTHYKIDHSNAGHNELRSAASYRQTDSLIDPYKLRLAKEINKELNVATDNLTKDGNETTIGNFMCDAIKWAYDSVSKQTSDAIVLLNRGGIRTNINKGIVTVNSMFELMPFENEIEAVDIKGSELKKIILVIIEKKHAFYNLKIEVQKNGTHIVNYLGKEISDEQVYTLITSDFLANGGDNFTFGKTKISSKKPNLKIRDALIYYCMHLKYIGKPITPYTDGRFDISK
jgi:2',3'-cyclic-nucleotide 2'-phosphodiesterase (5'-nucleotidase family)